MDRVAVRGLRAKGHHGVFEREREEGQLFVVDVEMAVDTRAAAADDDLTRTVHYGVVAEEVVGFAAREHDEAGAPSSMSASSAGAPGRTTVSGSPMKSGIAISAPASPSMTTSKTPTPMRIRLASSIRLRPCFRRPVQLP
jgi:hypothetical protein